MTDHWTERARPLSDRWTEGALCRGQDVNVWVGVDVKAPYTEQRALCAQCPVCQECLDYAVGMPDLKGCWGCTNELERRELRRGRVA